LTIPDWGGRKEPEGQEPERSSLKRSPREGRQGERRGQEEEMKRSKRRKADIRHLHLSLPA